MTRKNRFPRSLLASLVLVAPLLVGAEGGGCAPDDDIPIGSNDAGGSVKCGNNTCAAGQYCCNESCGICAKPNEGCIELLCGADDGGTGGVTCGKNVCGAGEYCCNASCGTCAKAGEACDAIACIDPCDAQDAQGEGPCLMAIGYAWDGDSCELIGGCSCKGSDCNALYQSPEACLAAHAQCLSAPGEPCGSATCAPGKVCCNESCGVCTAPGEACDLIACAPECNAQDAQGQGVCTAFFGYAWDGQSCYGISGCSCIGADCKSLYQSLDGCKLAHAKCS